MTETPTQATAAAATIAQARIATTQGQRTMTQLCKHWGHKFPVSYDATQGSIELPAGTCRLEVGADALSIRIEAKEASSLPRLEQVVEEHIKRFAFREQLAFDWTRSAG
jgi:hypothetical protein